MASPSPGIDASRTTPEQKVRGSIKRSPTEQTNSDIRRFRFPLVPTPWGTILKPSDMGLGHQTTMKPIEVALAVERLYNPPMIPSVTPKAPKHRWKGNNRKLDKEGIDQMIARLTRDSEEHTPETNRTMSNSPYKDMISIFTSYQIGGWDYWH